MESPNSRCPRIMPTKHTDQYNDKAVKYTRWRTGSIGHESARSTHPHTLGGKHIFELHFQTSGVLSIGGTQKWVETYSNLKANANHTHTHTHTHTQS